MMIFTVASALVYVKKRSIHEFIPESVKKVWTEWELRGLILLSLTLQILLILLGKRRKYIARTWIRFTLWSAYLTADWVATVALGVISSIASHHNHNSNYFNTHPDCRRCNNASNPAAVDRELMSFWAPFLLLHLGGPDTITAYSMEDNELWLRHLLGLAVQTGVAVYIFLTSLPGDSWLPLMSLPMFVAGLIKYGERTWALRAANTERLRESLLTRPDPGPNYAKFMEEFTLKKAEGFHVKAAEVMEEATHHSSSTNTGRGESVVVLKAYDLFQTFRRLFVDLILSFQDRDSSLSFFLESNWKTAFNVIEVELGFAFDVFYTKAAVVYTPRGGLLRLTSFSSTFVVLVAFVFLCNTRKDHYHLIDLIITYLLLVVAILLEMYAVFVMIRSNWTDHWLSKNKRTRDFLRLPCLQKPEKQWWSNSMAQYNLLSVCLRDKPAMCPKIQRLLRIDEFREKHRYKTYNNVSPKLKELIFNHFKKFMRKEDPSALCKHKGSFVLKEYEDCTEIEWSTKVDFDESILIWHIATDLCYYREMKDGHGGGGEDNTESNKEESKQISDYMLYLLVMCPALLPIGIGMIRFQDTCAEAREFFEERSHIAIIGNELEFNANACKKLLYVNTEVLPIKVKGDRSKSVLFDACRLAKSLRNKKGGKWEIVSHVWVEMLAYAATRCRGHQHAQQLRKGGELLTHVWLLMAHMGITEQFQIKGHARAKLIVK